jgi:hypothetical protein
MPGSAGAVGLVSAKARDMAPTNSVETSARMRAKPDETRLGWNMVISRARRDANVNNALNCRVWQVAMRAALHAAFSRIAALAHTNA